MKERCVWGACALLTRWGMANGTTGASELHGRQGREFYLGALYRTAGAFTFGAMGAVVKVATLAGIPTFEILFFRSVFAFVPILITLFLTTRWRFPTTRDPIGHLRRAVWGTLTLFFTFTAIGMLPLSSAVALSFAAPIFVVALSGLLLRERVGASRWVAVLIGCAGMALLVDPDIAEMASLGSVVAILAAVCAAFQTIAIRKLAHERAVVSTFYFAIATMLVSGAFLPFVWVTPSLPIFGALVLTGFLGATGQLLLTQALRLAPPAAVAPFDYSQLLWASLLGYAFWGETPTVRTVIGGLIIIGCGLFIVASEYGWRRLLDSFPLKRAP